MPLRTNVDIDSLYFCFVAKGMVVLGV